MSDELVIAGRAFRSRLIVGTGKYRSFPKMARAHAASGADMVTVFSLIARFNFNRYPDTLGFGKDFEAIVREWRPELVAA